MQANGKTKSSMWPGLPLGCRLAAAVGAAACSCLIKSDGLIKLYACLFESVFLFFFFYLPSKKYNENVADTRLVAFASVCHFVFGLIYPLSAAFRDFISLLSVQSCII